MNVFEIRLNLSLNPMFDGSDLDLGPGVLKDALSFFLKVVANTIAKIDNCPLKFSGIAFQHEFVGVEGLAKRFLNHYTKQAISQVYLIFGSSEALGNPVKLVKLILEGMYEFVYYPLSGFLTSPEAFWSGILRGSLSLGRKVRAAELNCTCHNLTRTCTPNKVIASLCSFFGDLCEVIKVGLVSAGLIDSPYVFQEDFTLFQQLADLTTFDVPSAVKRAALVPTRDLVSHPEKEHTQEIATV